MYQPTDERLSQFWSSLQTLWLQLYGSKMATVALINVSNVLQFYYNKKIYCFFLQGMS
jgi:hypothetical protein